MESKSLTVDYVVNDPKCLHEILRNLNINVTLKDIKQPTVNFDN